MDKSPATLRLDPARSRVFSWIEYVPDVPEDAHRPQTSLLRVRYRTNGTEMEFWPCSEEEAKKVMNPGAEFDYSIGRAFSQVISPYKSKRLIKSGDRQETKRQRVEVEERAGRRWLA
jgi:hypothetical protein